MVCQRNSRTPSPTASADWKGHGPGELRAASHYVQDVVPCTLRAWRVLSTGHGSARFEVLLPRHNQGTSLDGATLCESGGLFRT